MEPTERIEVRNVYVKSISIFGILYGLILGVVMALVVLISGLITPSGFKFLGAIYGATIGSLMLLVGMMGSCWILGKFLLG